MSLFGDEVVDKGTSDGLHSPVWHSWQSLKEVRDAIPLQHESAELESLQGVEVEEYCRGQ
jgi:hypothetical protein